MARNFSPTFLSILQQLLAISIKSSSFQSLQKGVLAFSHQACSTTNTSATYQHLLESYYYRLIMGILSTCFGFINMKRSVRHRQPLTRIEDLCHRFSLAQLQKATNNFDQYQKIGAGYTLYKGCINIGGTDYTVGIKRFSKEYGKAQTQLSDFKNETQLLCQLHHPNLISLIGFCKERNEAIVVYEYMANGSLHDHLYCEYNKVNKPLSWKKRLEICIGAARGLHYLHTGAKHAIYHRDIRLENILLDENWVPKVADLGISLKGPSSMSKLKSIQVDCIRGKVGYLPPEYAINGVVTDKCDVYLFGMIMLELVCGKKPINALNEIHDLNKAEDNDRDDDHDEDWKCYYSKIQDQAILICNNAEGYADKFIDPYIMGKIVPVCWKAYMDIATRCLHPEAIERPTMWEVQLELEHALEIQEAAEDANNQGIAALLMEIGK